MINIVRFLIDGQQAPLTTDNPHPSFSFVVDYEKNVVKIDKIILSLNEHVIDVTDKTYYIYPFDDLKPLSDYKVKLEVFFNSQSLKKEISFSTGLFSNGWNAPFISDPNYKFVEKHISPKVMSFKKTLLTNKPIKKARAFVTCFGVYNIYLDGHKLNEEYLLPGFTSYKHQLQYQTYDITTLLKKENELLIDVAGGWAIGSYVMNRVNRVSDDKQSLSIKILIEYKDGSFEEINTDDTWLVTTDTPYLFADLYDGEGYDATKERTNYHQASVYKTKCKPAVIANYGSPIVKKKVIKPKFSHRINEKDIYDLGQNLAGVISLHIKKANKGQEIIVKHAEILNTDKELNTAFLRSAKCEVRYICKEGEQEYSPTFSYMGFRYFSIEGIAKEDVEVEVYLLSSNLEEISTFECDNKLLNRLNENIYWSSISNFMDIPTDCPQRDERMGWTGDIAVFAPTALYNFEMTAFLNKWLKDLRSEQLKSGGIPNTIPNQGYGFPVTMPKMAVDFWGDASLLVPLALYQASGNIEIIKDSYDSMKKYVDACLFWAHLFSFGHRRYIWHTPSLFHFGDWIAPDVPKMSQWQGRSIYTATASLMNTSTILSNMAKLLGKNEDYEKYLKISHKVKTAFNRVLTNGKGKIKKEFQTGYVLPIYFNMFDENQKKVALERLVCLIKENNYHIGTGFPGTPYILFALADNGYSDVAYKMLLTDTCPSWLYEAKVGGTTIWERWDGLDENGQCPISNDGTGGMISYNHYASGAVGNFLYTRLAGLEMTKPGYSSFRVKPILCKDINYVKTSTISPYGKIVVSYQKDEKEMKIFVRVPLRSECELSLPNGDVHQLHSGEHEFKINL